jgi:hypothetical protein
VSDTPSIRKEPMRLQIDCEKLIASRTRPQMGSFFQSPKSTNIRRKDAVDAAHHTAEFVAARRKPLQK